MTKTELNKFRNILEAKQAELELLVRNRDGIAIEKSPDALDEVQHAAERELAIRNLDRVLHPLPRGRRPQSGGRRLRELRRHAGQRGLIPGFKPEAIELRGAGRGAIPISAPLVFNPDVGDHASGALAVPAP
jgi:hypothetical protein